MSAETSETSASPAFAPPPRFARFAWGMLAYTLAVIVFGAWVRITGSGAGCGQHWPTCHGELVHRPESMATLIELSHRVSSGLTLPLALVLMVWALRRFPKAHVARWGGVLTVVFLVIEALLGAGLVRFGLVENDDSISRAVVMAIHLTNTCILMGALATAAWGGSASPPRYPRWRGQGRGLWALLGGLLVVLLVSMSGAVTALGDTLYPVAVDGSVAEHLVRDQSVTAHFLQRMRLIHPLLAMGSALYLLWLAIALPGLGSEARPQLRKLGNLVAGLVLAQLCAGIANIMLSAPGWMQLLHLALATCLWTALVVLTLAAIDKPGR